MRMATEYGINDNALFLSTLETYSLQMNVLRSVRDAANEDDPTVEKEYVKGRKNLYVHPAVKELPRHVDSANKTAALLLDIIQKLGKPKQEEGDEFDKF